jgi:hypothetical protein
MTAILHGQATYLNIGIEAMPPEATFRQPVSQFGTGLGPLIPVLDWFLSVQYRIGSTYSGTGLVPASAFLFFPVPD